MQPPLLLPVSKPVPSPPGEQVAEEVVLPGQLSTGSQLQLPGQSPYREKKKPPTNRPGEQVAEEVVLPGQLPHAQALAQDAALRGAAGLQEASPQAVGTGAALTQHKAGLQQVHVLRGLRMGQVRTR